MKDIEVKIKLPNDKLGLENPWIRSIVEKQLESAVKTQIEQLLKLLSEYLFIIVL